MVYVSRSYSDMLDFNYSRWRFIQSRTFSYDMSTVNLMVANENMYNSHPLIRSSLLQRKTNLIRVTSLEGDYISATEIWQDNKARVL